jgi:hypothetical protein
MSVESKKPYKHQDKNNNYHPDVLTIGWTKRSVLLHFDDAEFDSATKNYKFTLNEPVTDLVFAEWITVNTGLVGSLMAVDEFNNDGQTTQKITALTPPAPPPAPVPPFIFVPPAIPTSSAQCTKYWRFLSDTNNYLSPSLAEPLMNPRNIYYLNVKLFTVAGLPKTVGAGSYVQLFLWTYCCKA